ncbi:hypothetical protein HOY80DRAFT_277427 [Tuber brumale]|nr:hypothetical protein HOY80DRAFT_277427 [Tuber brumale]
MLECFIPFSILFHSFLSFSLLFASLQVEEEPSTVRVPRSLFASDSYGDDDDGGLSVPYGGALRRTWYVIKRWWDGREWSFRFIFIPFSLSRGSALSPQACSTVAHLEVWREGDEEESACLPSVRTSDFWDQYKKKFLFFFFYPFPFPFHSYCHFFHLFSFPTPPFFPFPFPQRACIQGTGQRGGEASLWKDTPLLSPVTLTAVFSLHRFLSYILSCLSSGIKDAVRRASQSSLLGCRPCTASRSMFLPPFAFWCWEGRGGKFGLTHIRTYIK